MNYFVSHNGQQLGPFTEPDLKAKLASGEISAQDLVWWDGQADWKPIAQTALATSSAAVPPTPPPAPPVPPAGVVTSGVPETSGLAIASLVCGILSVFTACLAGIPAIILGHISLGRIKRDPSLQGRGYALAGTILGYVMTIVPIILSIIFSVLIALGQQVKDAAAAQASTNDTTIQAPYTTNSDTTPSALDTNSTTTPDAPATNTPPASQ